MEFDMQLRSVCWDILFSRRRGVYEGIHTYVLKRFYFADLTKYQVALKTF